MHVHPNKQNGENQKFLIQTRNFHIGKNRKYIGDASTQKTEGFRGLLRMNKRIWSDGKGNERNGEGERWEKQTTTVVKQPSRFWTLRTAKNEKYRGNVQGLHRETEALRQKGEGKVHVR